jgi:chorismate mutase
MDELTSARHTLDRVDRRLVKLLRRRFPYLRVLGTYPARTTADGTVDRVHAADEPKDG